jgi:hypothetical protein
MTTFQSLLLWGPLPIIKEIFERPPLKGDKNRRRWFKGDDLKDINHVC